MEIEVKGIDSLRDKLKKLPQILNQATNQAMFEVTETIRSTAEDNAPVGIYTGGGELKGSIHAIVDNEDGKIVGRVWSDKKQAIFTEFGTGPRGQASPKDLPEGIETIRYGAFSGAAIEAIHLPNTLKKIDKINVTQKKFRSVRRRN